MWRKDNEFCYPSDFYWLRFNKSKFKDSFSGNKIKSIGILFLFFTLPTICMLGYYGTYPFKWLNNKCEDWCYK